MKRAALLLPLLAIAGSCADAPRTEPSQNHDDLALAERIYAGSWTWGLAETVDSGIDKAVAGIRERGGEGKLIEETERIGRIMHAAFTLARLHREVLRMLAGRVAEQPELARRAGEWLERPEAARIREIERASVAHPFTEEDLRKFLVNADMEEDSITGRLTVLHDIHEREQALEQTMHYAIALTETILHIVQTGPSPLQHPHRLAAEQHRQLRDTIEPLIFAGRVYFHRTLQDDDLAAYREFLESEPGRWYATSLSEALEAALETVAAEVREARN